MSEPGSRIVKITLDEASIARRGPDIDHERAVAVFDLVEQNYFQPRDAGTGPYHLHLAVVENKLSLDIRSTEEESLVQVELPLAPFRRLVKDYFTICDSYFDAVRSAPQSRIEAIDMGRRALHNEGSELLQERLADRLEVDFDTARRLFTLLCALHLRL
ncbi:MAG: UPF0262 family protein [Proteobacteria bacterium]|nr:UPF0262 family protein [Pseudomonadota bacterium]MBI3498829.1 UPF0262 family protein [Pseudomonadota bacterium]